MKKAQKFKNKNAERRYKSCYTEINFVEPSNKEDILVYNISSLNDLLNTIKQSLFSIFSNSSQEKNMKNLLKQLKENLNSLLIEKNSTLKFYGETLSNNKCSLQNELFYENKIEINNNKYIVFILLFIQNISIEKK